ncbi:opacity family porin [Caviibacterium pharyngocola]|uniref:Porin n=1 Tax=Caviibacterium pharyngocola TaxID=28159 RepID=A0A2M8RX90_9PAST|nr:opacity family porin [Caviibacterium pharyngocola]PJG83492.1 porin [Caviibacterium pharyngocola]
MKKIFVVALGAFALVSAANANVYVQGDLGYSKIKSSGGELNFNKSAFSPSLAVGYKFVDWRLALDYTHYGNVKKSYTDVDELGDSISGSGELKTHSFGLSAIYDISLDTPIKPYVGARLGLNNLKWTENSTETTSSVKTSTSNSESSTKFGYGVFAGATYEFAPNWSLNGALEYNRLGKIEDVKFNQYGAKVGLRYEF